jgi:hypothetical protein
LRTAWGEMSQSGPASCELLEALGSVEPIH